MKRLLCGTLAACSMLATAQAADCAFANRQTRTMAGCLMYINQDDTVRIPNYISPFDTVDDISGAMSIATTDEPSYMAAYAVILKDGSLLTWGNNEYYQLGRSDSTAYPQKILSDIVSVSCGTVHMLAVKTDNTLWGWGDNSSNQLSNLYNTQTPTLLMTDVARCPSRVPLVLWQLKPMVHYGYGEMETKIMAKLPMAFAMAVHRPR